MPFGAIRDKLCPMADILTPEKRSRLMARIRGKNTKPELAVRRMLHAMGLRFRLHRRDLPGNPDIVLPRHGVCIFVHGCFWHLHRNCGQARLPKSRKIWWRKKLEGNSARDKRSAAALRRRGWRVLTVWECQIGPRLGGRLERAFSARSNKCPRPL